MPHVMKTDKKKRLFTLILPLVGLLLFVGLFVGSSISRGNLRKELTEMKDNTSKSGDKARLAEIEQKNKTISYIIGRDEELEQLIEKVRNKE